MKRLLLLALPVLLAGCTKPQANGDATTTPAPAPVPAPDAPAASAEAAKPAVAEAKVEFTDVAVIRIAGMLPKYQWRLASAADAKGRPIEALLVRPEQPITLDFASDKVSVGNACNRMSGGYKPGNRKVTIDKLASTMMACADPKLMALDREVGKRLEGDLALRMAKGDAKRLELKNAAGDVLVFAGVPTAATRYRGQESERVFLEVAAQTKPCSHPLIPGKQCLQVREVKYDDKGLKVGTPGAFEHFYSEIEGYTHEPGVRNVLRVNRYAIKNPPADAPSQAYVLDMVVESDASAKQR